jgi:signal transduction histidine kinase/ligand-binding sensor domain-containing protein/AraC-like DNA-binding protein
MKKLFLYLLFSVAGSLFAQSARLYSTAEGLISTKISQVTFDHDNFLWISTDMGLARFDGQTFTTYSRQMDSPFALHNSQVSCMFEDETGLHWVGTGNGLYYLCRTENKFTYYPRETIVPEFSVSRIVRNPLHDNELIVGTHGYGLFVFNTETRTYNDSASIRLSFQLKRWNCPILYPDAHNRLWVTNPQGLACINLETVERENVATGNIPIDDVVINDIAEDRRRDLLYLATLRNGLLCCNLSTLEMHQMDFPELNRLHLTALAMDPNGDLLIGTENEGLWRLHLGQLSRVVVSDCPVDLDHVKIHSIAFDDQHDLWLGLYQKGLLVIPKEKNLFRLESIREEDGIYNLGNISAFAYMSDGSRLYGIDGNGLQHIRPKGSSIHLNTGNSPLPTDAVISLSGIPENKAYVGTYNYGVFLYENGQLKRNPDLRLLDQQSIMTMVFDSLKHTLYIGTNGDGIYSYDINTRELRRISGENNLLWIVSLFVDRGHRLWASTEGSIFCFDLEHNKRIVPLKENMIRALGITEDKNGTIWFASNRGLLFYGSGSDSLQQVVDEEYGNDEQFSSLLQSADGRLWMPSATGLRSYDPRTKTFTLFLDPNISAVGSFSSRAAICWPDGTFSFGGDNGVLSFSPEAVYSYHRPLRALYLTRLWINNVPTDYDPQLSPEENKLDESLWKARRLHLKASENSFSVQFAVQEYCNAVGIEYAYHLKGYDNGWNLVHGEEKSAVYSSLPWGRYTLQVEARTIDGKGEVQRVTRELIVIIDAPWWASWWAYLLYAALLISVIVYSVMAYRTRLQQRRQMLLDEHNRQIKEAKLHMFASVSHEIKTPLTLIISPLRRLMDRNNDNATQSVYEMMYRNSLRILMLVNQQMDIQKLDQGKLNLHVSQLSIHEFISNIQLYFADIALSRQIDFRLLMPDYPEDPTFWADPNQLDKVFFNILSNAFKYVNDKGKVHIKVDIDEDQRTYLISIFNTGSHLEDPSKSHIFERFSSDGRNNIGLSLSNELVNLHHGKLTASNQDDGVVFTIELPMGRRHFTSEELKHADIPESTEESQKELEARALREESLEHQQKDEAEGKELIEMLNNELQEKQRQRQRRSNMGFDYSQKQLSSADEKLLNKVVNCIHKNLSDTEFNVDIMANEVGISRVHLNRKLQELINTSPSTLIKTTRLKQAAFLLMQNHVTIAEVAYSVGYSSPAYFTSNFSQYFSMSPKEFVNFYSENPDNPELKKLLE